MPHSSVAQESLAPLTRAVTYPDDLLPELQTTLAAMADLEVRYEKDQEQLTAWKGPNAIKERFAAQLEGASSAGAHALCATAKRTQPPDHEDHGTPGHWPDCLNFQSLARSSR
jgi:hypothetical protein